MSCATVHRQCEHTCTHTSLRCMWLQCSDSFSGRLESLRVCPNGSTPPAPFLLSHPLHDRVGRRAPKTLAKEGYPIPLAQEAPPSGYFKSPSMALLPLFRRGMPERRSCLRGSLLASRVLAWGLFMAQAHPRATQIGGSLWCFFRGVSGHIQRYARPVPSQKQQDSNCPSQPYLVSFCFLLLLSSPEPRSPSLFCHSEYFFGIIPCPLCHHLVPCAVHRGCHLFRS